MAQSLRRFETRTGQPFPVERFQRDFDKRLRVHPTLPEA